MVLRGAIAKLFVTCAMLAAGSANADMLPYESFVEDCGPDMGHENRIEFLRSEGWTLLLLPQEVEVAANQVAFHGVLRGPENESAFVQDEIDDAIASSVYLADPIHNNDFAQVDAMRHSLFPQTAIVLEEHRDDEGPRRLSCRFAGNYAPHSDFVRDQLHGIPGRQDGFKWSTMVQILGDTEVRAFGMVQIVTNFPRELLPDSMQSINLVANLDVYPNDD